jgi:hypothetical protein
VSAVLTHPSDYSPLPLPTLGERYTLMMESSNGYNMNGCCSRDMAVGGASDRMTFVVTGTSRSPQEELEQAASRQRKVFLKAQVGIPKLFRGRPLGMRIEKIELWDWPWVEKKRIKGRENMTRRGLSAEVHHCVGKP